MRYNDERGDLKISYLGSDVKPLAFSPIRLHNVFSLKGSNALYIESQGINLLSSRKKSYQLSMVSQITVSSKRRREEDGRNLT